MTHKKARATLERHARTRYRAIAILRAVRDGLNPTDPLIAQAMHSKAWRDYSRFARAYLRQYPETD